MRLIGSWDPPYGLPSRAPSEPDDIGQFDDDTGQFDDDTLSYRGLTGGSFLQHSPVPLPHHVSREPDLSTTYRTTNYSCTYLIMCKFSCSTTNMLFLFIVLEQQNTAAHLLGDPVQNENQISLQKQKCNGDKQRGLLDSSMKGSNNPGICNPDGIRLRGVSELRSCLPFCITS